MKWTNCLRLTSYNLTLGERHAIQRLKNSDDLMVRSADKGGAMVVQNNKQYIDEALKLLTYILQGKVEDSF